MKRKETQNKNENSTSKIINGIITTLVGIGIGIGAKALYDGYKNSKKDETKTKKTNEETKDDEKEDEKKEITILKDKEENITLEQKETTTTNGNIITANDENEVIESMICPINQTIMNDPVVTPYGITYERSAIEEWLKKNNTDPIAKKPLTKEMLVTNYALKSVIKEYLKQESQNEKIETIK